jgi:hypothetical protein
MQSKPIKPKAHVRVGESNVGEEMKQIYNGSNAVASINVAADQTDKSNANVNSLVVGVEKKSEESKNITHQNVNGVASIQSSSGANSDLNNNNNNNNNPNHNVNFANAVFNKHFVNVPQTNHNDSTLPDVSVNSVNLSSAGETSLSDDLSSMPVIDDKSLLASLKAKFEARKYYVSIAYPEHLT